jgi:hypothetical protein
MRYKIISTMQILDQLSKIQDQFQQIQVQLHQTGDQLQQINAIFVCDILPF